MSAVSPIPVPRPRTRRLLLGCLGAFVLLIVVGGAGWWFALCYRANQRLAEEVAKVRARGEPLTTVELNDSYVAEPGRPDMTKEILEALAILNSPDLLEIAHELPVVGVAREHNDKLHEVPSVGQSWQAIDSAEAYLKRQVKALETFRKVADSNATARYPVDLSTNMDGTYDHLQWLRHAFRVLTLDFYVHLHRGRVHEAADSVVVQIALLRTLDQEPTASAQVVRLGLCTLPVEEFVRSLQEVNLNDADIVRAQTALQAIDMRQTLKRALIGSRSWDYTACVESSVLSGEVTSQQARDLALRRPIRVIDAVKILETDGRLIAAADISLQESLAAATKTAHELETLQSSMLGKYTHAMSLELVPVNTHMAAAFASSAARRDAVVCIAAAELYRRKRGYWPQTLTQLVPEYLAAVPIDPFDGQPLRMKVSPEELTVYSIGRDGTDDGGKLSDKNPPNPDIGFSMPTK